MWILTSSTTSVWNISHSMKNWAIYDQKHVGLHVKYPLLLSDFNKTWIFSKHFRKNSQISSVMKIRPVVAELFHAGGRTDRQTGRHDKANSSFSQFCERAKKATSIIY